MGTQDTRAFVTAVFESWENDGDTTSKQEYIERVYQPLDERLERWPVPRVLRIVADGDWAVVLWHGAEGRGRRGEDYVMHYTWWMRVRDDRVLEVIGFDDDANVNALFAP